MRQKVLLGVAINVISEFGSYGSYCSLTWYFPFLVDSFGSVEVAELDWGNEDHIKAVNPPFDFIIGTDVVSLLDEILFLPKKKKVTMTYFQSHFLKRVNK